MQVIVYRKSVKILANFSLFLSRKKNCRKKVIALYTKVTLKIFSFFFGNSKKVTSSDEKIQTLQKEKILRRLFFFELKKKVFGTNLLAINKFTHLSFFPEFSDF